jgi:hypothetical protein
VVGFLVATLEKNWIERVPIKAAGPFVLLGVAVTLIAFAPQTRSSEPAVKGNRLLEHAAWINTKLHQLDPDARARLEQMLELEPQEAIACLEGQARAAAREIITRDEALTIYQALTPEGWEPGTRLEVKMTIISIMDGLLTPLSRLTSQPASRCTSAS